MSRLNRIAFAALAALALTQTTGCFPLFSDTSARNSGETFIDEEAGGSPETAPAPESQQGGGIGWDEAASYEWTYQRVCGPFAGWGNSNDDVFLNLGVDYPDPDRFQIVIWDVGGIEPIPDTGTTICTSGEITSYEGVPQIELHDPSLIEIYG